MANQLTAERTVVEDQLPTLHRLSIAVNPKTVEVVIERPTHKIGDSGQYKQVLEDTVISLELDKQEINQYTDIETQSESFNSRSASKSDRERFALVEVDPDGGVDFYPTQIAAHDSLYPIHDDSVWGMRLDGIPGVLVSRVSRTDTCESYRETKIRITREAVDHVRESGCRLIGIKWREASGGSVNNNSWSKSEGIEAVEFVGADK